MPLRRDAASPGDTPPEPEHELLALFGQHGGALFRFARSVLGDVSGAEDVVQETFLKLLQHLRNGGGRTNLRAWLFTVAANACRTRVRFRARWLPWRAETDARTVEIDDETLERRRARAALRTLRPRDRLLLALRAQGMSYAEIAAAAGIERASVGRLLARAVDRWKRAVAR